MSNIFLKILVLIAIIITVIKAMVVPLVKELLRLRKIQKRGKFASGVVIGFNEKKDLDKYNQYAKIVEFETESNEKIILEDQEYTFRKPLIGESVKVLYDKENPQNAIADYYKTFVFKLFLIIFVCAILLSIVIVSIKIFPT